MSSQSSRLYLKILIALLACVILILVALFRESIWESVSYSYHLLADRDRVRNFIASFGWGAPLVFMGIQISQVIFAPVPGEATGFIGGYLFGVLKGFLYSSAALGVGSWINFSIGRFLGVRFVRKMIPADKFEKFSIPTLSEQSGNALVPEGAAAWMGCEVESSRDIKGYRLFIGRVVDQHDTGNPPLIWQRDKFFGLKPI